MSPARETWTVVAQTGAVLSMSVELLLYTRKDCCLCDEMKNVISQVVNASAVVLSEIDVDSVPDLRDRYGSEVPVLFINGRKAFKYRVTPSELVKRIRQESR